MKGVLTRKDVDRLLVDRSSGACIDTIAKVVEEGEAAGAGSREQALAQDIIMRFADHAEVAVREAVAWQLYNSPLLHDDLARRLARDVAQVAFPVLRYVEEFSDDFLISVVDERDPEKQYAIAGRRRLSPDVSEAIVDLADIKAIARLMRNTGADINEPTLHKVVDRYGEIGEITEPMARRDGLPLPVLEKLVTYVSEEIRQTLVDKYRLPPAIAKQIVKDSRESATVLLLQPVTDRMPQNLVLFCDHLYANNRLTPSLLFRALCSGDVALFETGMATRCRIPVASVRVLLYDDGPLGLKASFEKARLPLNLMAPFRSALQVVKETGYAGQDGRRREFQIKVIGRVFNECSHIEDGQVDELLLQLFDQKSPELIEQALEEAGIPFVPLRAQR